MIHLRFSVMDQYFILVQNIGDFTVLNNRYNVNIVINFNLFRSFD